MSDILGLSLRITTAYFTGLLWGLVKSVKKASCNYNTPYEPMHFIFKRNTDTMNTILNHVVFNAIILTDADIYWKLGTIPKTYMC